MRREGSESFMLSVLTLCVCGDKLYLKRTNFSKWDT